MNEKHRAVFINSRLVQEKFPLYLERFTLIYYSLFLTAFFISIYLNPNENFNNENQCETLYKWNFGCFFFCIFAVIFVFVLKWLRKTLDVPIHKLLFLRIIIIIIISCSFIVGIAINIADLNSKECKLFYLIDVVFISAESTLTLALIVILVYALYFLYIFRPSVKPTPLPKPKIQLNSKKNFELLPIESF